MASVIPVSPSALDAPVKRAPLRLVPAPSMQEVLTREVYVPVQSKFAVALTIAAT
jgi:hypothetical protein